MSADRPVPGSPAAPRRRECLHFVVPARDEAENLPALLDDVRRHMRFSEHPYRVVVVDDGSVDGTADVAEAMSRAPHWVNVEVLRHAEGRGPGAAFATGFRRVLEDAADHDLLVTLEADNTSDLSILARMTEQAGRGADLVLASVYGNGRIVGAPLFRRVLSAAANLLSRAVFGLWQIHTFSSFFRVHRVALVRRATRAHGPDLVEERGFACMLEMLVKFHRLGARVTEVPMLLDASMRKGPSKMRVARTVRAYLRVFWRLGLARRGAAPTAQSAAAAAVSVRAARRALRPPAVPVRVPPRLLPAAPCR